MGALIKKFKDWLEKGIQPELIEMAIHEFCKHPEWFKGKVAWQVFLARREKLLDIARHHQKETEAEENAGDEDYWMGRGKWAADYAAVTSDLRHEGDEDYWLGRGKYAPGGVMTADALVDFFDTEIHKLPVEVRGPQPLNKQELAKAFEIWIEGDGMKPELIKAMIDEFCQSPEWFKGKPVWKAFLARRQQLLDIVKHHQEAQEQRDNRTNPDYWLGYTPKRITDRVYWLGDTGDEAAGTAGSQSNTEPESTVSERPYRAAPPPPPPTPPSEGDRWVEKLVSMTDQKAFDGALDQMVALQTGEAPWWLTSQQEAEIEAHMEAMQASGQWASNEDLLEQTRNFSITA